MFYSFVISLASAICTSICNAMPADSLYEDFYPLDNSYLLALDDNSPLSSNSGDTTFDPSQPSRDDKDPFLISNDQASLESSDQFSNFDDLSFDLETPSCKVGRRDGAGCYPASVTQGRLELPDLLQIETIEIKDNPLFAPITIVLGDGSLGKCVNQAYPLNLCCDGPLGALADGLWPLMIYRTIDNCRHGK